MVIFILHPGKVRVPSMNKVVNISAADLVALYGLNQRSCAVARTTRTYVSNESIQYVHVWPQESGCYSQKDLDVVPTEN